MRSFSGRSKHMGSKGRRIDWFGAVLAAEYFGYHTKFALARTERYAKTNTAPNGGHNCHDLPEYT